MLAHANIHHLIDPTEVKVSFDCNRILLETRVFLGEIEFFLT